MTRRGIGFHAAAQSQPVPIRTRRFDQATEPATSTPAALDQLSAAAAGKQPDADSTTEAGLAEPPAPDHAHGVVPITLGASRTVRVRLHAPAVEVLLEQDASGVTVYVGTSQTDGRSDGRRVLTTPRASRNPRRATWAAVSLDDHRPDFEYDAAAAVEGLRVMWANLTAKQRRSSLARDIAAAHATLAGLTGDRSA